MRITAHLTDETILKELGGRLASMRLARNLTQAALAEQAGVSKRTVERLESGEVATRVSGFLRVCRTLGLLEGFDALIPESTSSPMEQLRRQGKKRQRATARSANPGSSNRWTWDEPS